MTKFWSRIVSTLVGAPKCPPVAPSPVPEPVVTGRKRGRPPSPALLRTIELVRRRRDITHREIAEELGVSPAYARTLLRRAQSKAAMPVVMPPPPPREDMASTVAGLEARLEEAEQALAMLRSTPPQARGSWNLLRRAEVLRLASAGAAPGEIAATLSIPAGEVEFILKVDRVLQAAG